MVKAFGLPEQLNGCNPLKGIEHIATRGPWAKVSPVWPRQWRCNPLKGIEHIATDP